MTQSTSDQVTDGSLTKAIVRRKSKLTVQEMDTPTPGNKMVTLTHIDEDEDDDEARILDSTLE